MMRLAVVASHPIQYQAPLFRNLAKCVDLTVYYAQDLTPQEQSKAGFSVGFNWDIDLLTGYNHRFLRNVSTKPGISFAGSDTPEISTLLGEGRHDSVLILGWYLKSFVQAAWSCKRLGIPVMVRGDNHLLEPRSRFKTIAKAILYPPALRMFDAALHVGERSRQYFEHYRYPKSCLFFSPHGVDERSFETAADLQLGRGIRSELGIAEDDPIFLFAGKLIQRKRVHDLLAAAKICEQNGQRAHVVIAGSGPLEVELRNFASELGIRAHFMGFQNQSKIPAIYAASTVMVLPSDNESWGLVANEALACRRPIVLSSAVGAAPDLAGDGQAGRVFNVGDRHHLAAMLLDILRRPPDRDAIKRKSRDYSTYACATGILEAMRFVALKAKPNACR